MPPQEAYDSGAECIARLGSMKRGDLIKCAFADSRFGQILEGKHE